MKKKIVLPLCLLLVIVLINGTYISLQTMMMN